MQRARLLLWMLPILAGPAAAASNKWRIEVSEGANSAGTITFGIEQEGEAVLTVQVAIPDGYSENHVARTIKKALRAQLPRDRFKVEMDDGEDVLLKKRHFTPNFDLKLIENSVRSVRINLDRE